MSKNIKGITIEIGGNVAPLHKALESVNKQSKDMQGELRQVERLLKLDPTNTELLAQKQKLLTDAIGNSKDKLDTLKEAEKQVQKQFEEGKVGEDQYRAIQREVISTEQNLKNLEGKLKDTNTRWQDLSDNLESAGKKMKDIGSTMSTRVTAPIVGGAIAAVEGTREFREELARLETNAQMAGANVDITKEALRNLGQLSDDSGANVEALSNLLQAGFTDNTLTDVVNELSGAVLKFPDTLKIEGLADGLQETLATGKAIGPFAELLERMGVDLETFNEGLANASKEGEQHNFVMQELANLGLAEVNEAYRENNSALIEAAESQNRLKEATAELADIIEPILTTLKDVLANVIEKFLELSPEMQRNIGIVLGLVAAVGPLLMIVGQISLGISALIGLFGGTTAAAAGATTATGGLSAVIAAITGPVGIAIAAIAGIIAILVTAWKTNEEFRDNVTATWEQIKEVFTVAFEAIKAIFKAAWDIIIGLIYATLDIIKGLYEEFIGLFTEDWKEFAEGIKTTWSGMWDGIKEILEGVWELLTTAFNTLYGKIKGWFTGLAKDAYDWGKNMIDGFIDGIKAMAGAVRDAVSSVMDGVKDFIGFNSPSKKGEGRNIVRWGENMLKGFMDGIDNVIPDLNAKLTEVIPNINPIVSNSSTTNNDNRSDVTLIQHIHGNVKSERALQKEAIRQLRDLLPQA